MRILLNVDDTESAVLDESVEGRFQVSCDIYVADVKMQFSDDGGTTWVDGSFNGTPIKLSSAGDIFDQEFTRGRFYKFVTATKGSRVSIDKHSQAG